MRFQPPPTNACNSAGDGLLYLPGLSLATPQYSCRIKWQAIYNASVKADCPPSSLDLEIGPECLAGSQSPYALSLLLFPVSSQFWLPRHQVIPLHVVILYWNDHRHNFSDCSSEVSDLFAACKVRDVGGKRRKQTGWPEFAHTFHLQSWCCVKVFVITFKKKVRVQTAKAMSAAVCVSREGRGTVLFIYI